MSIYQETGALFLGTRLKRLSDRFLGELTRIYRARHIEFEVGWFPVFFLLDAGGEVTISQIANQLEISHSAASQMVTALNRKGFLHLGHVKEDRRIKTVALSPWGLDKLKEIKPVWEAIQTRMDQTALPGDPRPRVLALLQELESGLDHLNLAETVQADMATGHLMDNLVIRPYTPRDKEGLNALTLAWLSRGPEALPHDLGWMPGQNHCPPTTLTLALHDQAPVAACALTPMGGDTELCLVHDLETDPAPVFAPLLDQALPPQDTHRVSTWADTQCPSVLKLFRDKGFQLMDIQANTPGPTAWARLSTPIPKEKERP